MELDELKTVWKNYDTKLQTTQVISDRLIVSMIKEKSQSRLTKVKRRYLILVLYLSLWLIAGLAVIIGNPFDYKQYVEFLPMAIYCLCMCVLVIAMIRTNSNLQKIEISQSPIDVSLKKIIEIIEKYENPNRLLGWTLKILLASTTVFFPLSFLPRKIERVGLWHGVLDTIIPICISLALIFIAYKLGAFKERYNKRFKEYLDELNELKTLSKELAG